MIRTVIIDDEQHAIDTLSAMIRSFVDLDLVGQSKSVASGIVLINEFEPDLVFLDVEMGDGTGFDLLEKLDRRDFQIIFITAYDQYAINAFKYSAIEYLLKPLISEELSYALDKVRKTIASERMNNQLTVLLDNINDLSNTQKKIVLKEADAMHVIKIADILWCSAQGSYCTFSLVDGREITISKNLKEYEELLSPNGFFRIHRSYLINLSKVKKFSKAEGGTIILEGDISLPVSTRKREKLTELLANL